VSRAGKAFVHFKRLGLPQQESVDFWLEDEALVVVQPPDLAKLLAQAAISALGTAMTTCLGGSLAEKAQPEVLRIPFSRMGHIEKRHIVTREFIHLTFEDEQGQRGQLTFAPYLGSAIFPRIETEEWMAALKAHLEPRHREDFKGG
jgi:hypothetical protein